MYLALCLLLGVCAIYTKGDWFFIATFAVLSISTLLNALYYIPALMNVFANTGDEVTLVADKKDFAFMISMVVFMAMNFVLGCCSAPVVEMLTQGIRMLG